MNWGQFAETAGVVLGTLVLSYPIFKAAVRDVLREELSKFEEKVEFKEQSQLRWEGHRLEVVEMRRRYDADLDMIKRRLELIEAVLNHKGRKDA